MKVPEVIGRYEIIEELGRGAMGSVFKARDPAVGRVVALKTIHTTALEGAQAEEYRARFYREARASGVLAHPGIVPVFDVGEHQGAPFLVMEFVDGKTLADAIKKGERFTLDRVCLIGQQLADALDYAHRQGVIHRDIKPANILLTSREVYGSERPRITDFGIAKLVASEITTTGQLLGTPSFMPPEQFTGAPVDGRADLFSLGVILYSLSTGEQPFPGETMTAVSYKVVHTEPVPPSKLNPAVTARLESVILKCLAKNPAERYQSGDEVAQDLAAIRASVAASLTQPSAHPASAVSASADTMGPAGVSVSQPPNQTQSSPAQSAPSPSASLKAEKKKTKPVQFETVFAAVLLAIAGMAVAGAAGWFLFQHAFSSAHRNSSATPVAQTSPQPAPAAPAAPPLAAAPSATPPDAAETQAPPQVQPPAATSDASKAASAPTAATPAEARPAAVKKAAAKPLLAQSAPAPAPSPATPAPAPVAVKVQPSPPPAATPAATPPATTASASHPAAGLAFDPRRLNPDTNARLRIELEHFPFGVPYTVEMNGKVYLRGITGEQADLDNLFVPPGVQEFRLTMRSGGQQKASNVVSDEFKAKKRKTLRAELHEQAGTPGSSAEPISSAQVVLSLK